MEAIFQRIMSLLKKREMSAEELSLALGVEERGVYEPLSVISRSLDPKKERFIVRPARCSVCGYAPKTRDLSVLPTRCRQCRAAPLKKPAYRICPVNSEEI